ncbi:MAG: shikimate kinase [Streptococcaceae bacterium]|jgi:shikimate kinase|nr:shikimate kinase [Streptococcaceae bacterium]
MILIGFMGAGKSTIARLLDINFVDTDAFIEAKVGMKTPAYFERYGEQEFRRREEEALAEILAARVMPAIISTGGGLIESARNQALLADRHDVVYLKADFETLVARLSADTLNRRSLFENSTAEEFRAVFDRRQAIYEKLSALTVTTEQKTPEEIADEIRRFGA